MEGDGEHNIWTGGEIGQLCGAHVGWCENRCVRAVGESAGNGSVFGVEWELGGSREL